MYACMNGYRQNCMNVCMCLHIYTYMHTKCNSWQYVFQSKNPQVIIDMKEQIQVQIKISVSITEHLIVISIVYR